MSVETLKHKLIEDAKVKGVVALKSSDVAEFTGGAKKELGALIEGDVSVKVDAPKDPLLDAGGEAKPGEQLSETVDKTKQTEKAAGDISGSQYDILDQVVVTTADRESFLQALITGNRFVATFALFNGRITGKIRSRSQSESHALIAQLNRECRDQLINTELDYATRIRNMLLATQIQELNGEQFVDLEKPYMAVVKSGVTTEPGWLAQVEYWANKNEGLVSAIYRELQTFEKKYWTMVNNARDQNFWNPAEST